MSSDRAVASGTPRHREIVRELESAIGSGVYEPGERLPSVRALASSFGVGVNTVREAIALLEDSGIVRARERSGVYVVATPLASEPRDPTEDALLSLVPDVDREHDVRNAVVHLDHDWMPEEFVSRSLLSRALRREANEVSSPTTGYVTLEKSEALRAFVAQRVFASGTTVAAADVVLTDGITNGIARALQYYHAGTGRVAVEAPTHHTLRRILGALGVRVVPIPVDDDGLRMDLLEDAIRRQGVTTLLTTPDFHNPTGVVLASDRRRAIAELADRGRLLVIEDGVHRETSFASRLPPPILSFSSGDRVLLCSNFSEVIAPSLKVGWVVTRRDASGFHDYVRTTTCTVPGLSVALLQRIVGSGGFERHRMRLARRIASSLGRARTDILECFPNGTDVSRPMGGYSLWVRLPTQVTATSLFYEARREGIGIVPGSLFAPARAWEHHIRVNPGAYGSDASSAIATLGTLVHRLANQESRREP